MDGRRLTLKNRIESLGYSIRGIAAVFRSQPNMWIIAAATVTAIIIAGAVPLTRVEWSLIFIVILIVWIMEIFNTAIEYLVDLVAPDYHPLAGKAKDAAAAATLVACALAVIVAILILWPKFYAAYFNSADITGPGS